MFIERDATRRFLQASARRRLSAFWDSSSERATTSYIFAGDMNGDTRRGNDLIYIPRDKSEMNFAAFTPTTGMARSLFTADEQAAAWDAYIQQDPYLSEHRGEYAERNARVPADGQAHGLQHQPGCLHSHFWTKACGSDSPRRHQLRQPAELKLGRRPARDAERRS